MKTLLLASAAFLAFSATAAMADDTAAAPAGGKFAYNIGVTNDYIFRGLSQNLNHAAVQGGVDYTNNIFYAGTWLSNVADPDKLEGDIYAGFRPSLGKASFDFGAITYNYDHKEDVNTDLKAVVSYPVYKATVSASYFHNTTWKKNDYYEFDAAYPINDKLSLSGALGSYVDPMSKGGHSGYSTGNIGLTYQINSTWSLDGRYADTSLPKDIKASRPTFAFLLKAAF